MRVKLFSDKSCFSRPVRTLIFSKGGPIFFIFFEKKHGSRPAL